MAIEKRKSLMHVLFTLDCDSLGPERLKRSGVASYAVGLWDTERPDPRPRDGVNAPVDLPPQMGFWAQGFKAQREDEELLLGEGSSLPPDLADMLNAAALRQATSQEALIRGMRQEGLALAEQLRARDETIQGQTTTITSLQQDAANKTATIEGLQEDLSAAQQEVQAHQATITTQQTRIAELETALGENGRHLVPKLVIIDRLIAVGLLDVALAALAADVVAKARWDAATAVYTDDATAIALMTAIGADPTVILAPV